MIRGYSAEAIRAAEAPLLAAGVPLMRHAALALAFTAMSEIRARGQRVAGSVTLSLVGGGNNGGDALWAAAELAHRGVQAWAALCAPSVHEEGLAACRAAGVRIVRVVPEGTPESPAPRRESAELLADDAARDPEASATPPGRAVPLRDGAAPRPEATGHLPEGAVPLHDGDATRPEAPRHLPEGAVPLHDGAVPLPEGAVPLHDGAAPRREAPGHLPEGAPTAPLALADLGALVATARRAGVWLDGLAGIGVRGALREPLRSIIEALDSERRSSPDEPVVIAVDVPSGISDDGTAPEAVLPAHVTVTMGAAKPGLLLPPADALAGRIDVVDLGLPLNPAHATVARWTAPDAVDAIAWPRWEDHKYTRGVVGIAAGTEQYPGAGRLASEGALACGIGMVRYLGELEGMPLTLPEVVTAPGRVQALVLGPGGAGMDLGLCPVPVVLDAAAVERRARTVHPAGAILTPHAGELAALLGIERAEVEANPAAAAVRAAMECRAVVMLKGAVTVVAVPDGGPLLTIDAGTAWLATAGTGDVLAGITGALVASRQARAEEEGRTLGLRELGEIAASAAWLHGEASREIDGPLRASDLPRAVTRVLHSLAP